MKGKKAGFLLSNIIWRDQRSHYLGSYCYCGLRSLIQLLWLVIVQKVSGAKKYYNTSINMGVAISCFRYEKYFVSSMPDAISIESRWRPFERRLISLNATLTGFLLQNVFIVSVSLRGLFRKSQSQNCVPTIDYWCCLLGYFVTSRMGACITQIRMKSRPC